MDAELRPIGEILSGGSASVGREASRLADLSNLTLEESDAFNDAWTRMEAKHRRKVIGRLVELAEDNVELNFDVIFKLCLEDPDDEVRRRAIEGLWENEETSLIGTLLKILGSDPSDEVRAMSASALGRFTLLGEHGKLRAVHVSRIKDGLLSVARAEGEGEEVRRRALEAIAPLSVPEVRSAIQSAYNGRSTRLRASSVYAMGKNCDISWLPVLLQELDSGDAEMRFEAASALGELGEESSVPTLIEIADDPDAEVRMAVLQALGKIGGRKSREHLQRSLSSEDQAIRDAAEQALEELKTMEDPLSLQL